MAALGWSIHKQDNLVVVSGVGVFDLPFLLSYAQATRRQAPSAIASCSICARRTSS